VAGRPAQHRRGSAFHLPETGLVDQVGRAGDRRCPSAGLACQVGGPGNDCERPAGDTKAARDRAAASDQARYWRQRASRPPAARGEWPRGLPPSRRECSEMSRRPVLRRTGGASNLEARYQQGPDRRTCHNPYERSVRPRWLPSLTITSKTDRDPQEDRPPLSLTRATMIMPLWGAVLGNRYSTHLRQ